MAELRSAIFWVLCPKQSLHCYISEVWGSQAIICSSDSANSRLTT
ncbi:MAG: hypothetical protein ACK54J_17510 [Pseudanabaena sp.]